MVVPRRVKETRKPVRNSRFGTAPKIFGTNPLSQKTMPTPQKHPITGCRTDTVFGDWLITQDKLESFRDMGWAILEKGELKNFQSTSQEMSEQKEERPYAVQDGMARIDINGPMTKMDTSLMSLFGGTSTMRVRKSLADARQRYSSGEIKGVFIDLDSPGGTVDGTAELANSIRKTAKVMPVFVHAQDMACSAALWIGTQGTRFTVGPTASVGSLGTRVTLTDASKVGETSTVKPVIVDTGVFKSIGAPGKPITDEQKAEIRRYAESMNKVFKDEVKSARNMTAAQITEAATARVYVGEDAVKAGLADAVCSTDEAFEHAKEQIKNPKLDRRSPSLQGNNSTAPVRSRPMPQNLTASQLVNLGKLPGAAGVTEDTAEVKGYEAAMHLNQRVTELTTSETALKTENTRLTQELADAQAKIPKPIHPEVLQGLAGVACQSLKMKLDGGKITTAQFGFMVSALLSKGEFKDDALSADAVPVAALFEKDASGKYVYQKVFAAFDEKAPADLIRDNRNDQRVDRKVPSEDSTQKDAIDNVGKEAEAWKQKRLEERGVKA